MYSAENFSGAADISREEMLNRCQIAMDMEKILVNAGPGVDVKPLIEYRHAVGLGCKRNPAADAGSMRFRTDFMETGDAKPRGLGRLKINRDEVQETRVQKKIKQGMSCVHEEGPSKIFILSNLKGGALPKLIEWEKAAITALQKYFGHQQLKSFQREAVEAWAENRDCFVLAATGSGKSLCFQLPALMTGKVVVVVSPLISLMHDQCLQLARQGVSACFLGSGQVDKTIELKAMAGIYNIVYVCPETLPRLENYFQGLARGKGIALFAVDEAHCISKWGHDFRPTYRQLSMLRDKFKVGVIPGLKHQIPIMALTATATPRVRKDILTSLGIAAGNPRIVLTTFFRPNLYFSVHHSKTTMETSYEHDFSSLIKTYTEDVNKFQTTASALEENLLQERNRISSKEDNHNLRMGLSQLVNSTYSVAWPDNKKQVPGKKLNQDEDLIILSDENEEEEDSSSAEGDDLKDTDCDGAELTGEVLEDEDEDERFGGDCFVECGEFSGLGAASEKSVGRLNSIAMEMKGGPTIIYTPTRKETEAIAKFLCGHGAKPLLIMLRAHLRQVHEGFHGGTLQVVVATIAFGMGIDKPNVRRVIHYGWPQSLEAYYQEAGRAGRDGSRSNCALRFFPRCDVCLEGPPPAQNLAREAVLLLAAICNSKELHKDRLWWRGFVRILADRGYIRNTTSTVTNKLAMTTIRYPRLTSKGLRFLRTHVNAEASQDAKPLMIHLEGDMIQALRISKNNKEQDIRRSKGIEKGVG
uniref:DNA 3'-5' helicase n=1 Tax=Physcomitrium patens TaxID=3218 RepID=A0A2K1IJU0_PHYPA|nr:hypothetical protein PHYPA_028237 [Physcomitrium patens]